MTQPFDLKDGRWTGMQWCGDSSCGFGGNFDSIHDWYDIHPDWLPEIERLAKLHGGLKFGDDDSGALIYHQDCPKSFHVYWYVCGPRKNRDGSAKAPKEGSLFALLEEAASKQKKYRFILSKTTAPTFCNFEPFEQGLEEDSEFRAKLRRNFDEGLKKHGKGAVICDESRGNLSYVTLDEFLEGAKDCLSKRATKTLINACTPDQHIVVIAMLDNGFENNTYSYQAFLVAIPKEVQS